MRELGELIAGEDTFAKQCRETAAARRTFGGRGFQRRMALVLQSSDHVFH